MVDTHTYAGVQSHHAVMAGLAGVEVAALRAMVHGLPIVDRPLAHVAEAGVLVRVRVRVRRGLGFEGGR